MRSPLLSSHLYWKVTFFVCAIIKNFKAPLFLKDQRGPLNTGLNVLASVQSSHITNDILTVILKGY
jgi:hypothetical protein